LVLATPLAELLILETIGSIGTTFRGDTALFPCMPSRIGSSPRDNDTRMRLWKSWMFRFLPAVMKKLYLLAAKKEVPWVF
jgi:hypothetical protein